MVNNYKIIDEKPWERALYCIIFINSIEPQFCVTFETDITYFKEKVKNQG
jgi:chloramphenicol O-acetyltransferase type B